jgi:hypothetical protein
MEWNGSIGILDGEVVGYDMEVGDFAKFGLNRTIALQYGVGGWVHGGHA